MNEEACTTIIVGSEMMADGSMIYARSDDSRSIRATRLVHYPAGKGPKEFVAIDSAFRCPLPARRFGFSALEREDLPYHWGEAGFNDRGVAMSATETIFSSEKVLALDPYVLGGLAENCVYHIILPYIKTAREGVLRLGSLIEEYGSAEGFGIAFMDADETWYLENAGGHRWLAKKMPSDKYFVSGNQSRYRDYDPENDLASADLVEWARENHLFEGEFDFHEAYSLESENDKTYNYPRVWYLQKKFTPSVETDVKVNNFPVYQTADRPLTVDDIKKAFRSHYDGTEHDPYLHSNPKEPYRPVSIFRTINTHILQVRPGLHQLQLELGGGGGLRSLQGGEEGHGAPVHQLGAVADLQAFGGGVSRQDRRAVGGVVVKILLHPVLTCPSAGSAVSSFLRSRSAPAG